MSATLTKSRSVLHSVLLSADAANVQLHEALDRGGFRAMSAEPVMTVDRSSWEEMGRPHEVTVTVEPGDLLNT